MTKGWCKSFKTFTETPVVQCFSTDSRGTSLGHQWASVSGVCFLQSCSTFSLKRYCRRLSMTTTPLSPSVEDPSPTFADDIDPMGDSRSELQYLINRLYERARACGIAVSSEQSKIMVNSTTNTRADMNDEKQEKVTSFKYFGATLSNNGTSIAVV